MQYRPDIDGLRAIAVISVILYHAEFSIAGSTLFPGGFIGVDIFFVISGYLITKILLGGMMAGEFSILKFYEKRARRILPALFLVLIASIPLALAFLFPDALNSYAKSLLATIFFASNIFFLTQNRYGADPAAYEPLLHTWSLAVEEQFYLIFPAILLLTFKFLRQHLLYFFIVGFIVSLALAEWTSRIYIDANFYLLPTRGWELIAGAIIAIRELNHGRFLTPLTGRVLAPIALTAIVASFMIFDDTMRHPSLLTAIPVIATAMLIAIYLEREEVLYKGYTYRVLTTPALVGIGLASYSLYLWHQPILAFARNASSDELLNLEKIGLLLFAAGLSVLSWRFIEKPFRNASIISTRTLLATLSVTAGVLVISSFYLVYKTHSSSNTEALRSPATPTTYDTELLVSSATKATHNFAKLRQHNRQCFYHPKDSYCEFSENSNVDTVILLGDSHADMLAPNFHKHYSDGLINLTVLTRSACPFVLSLTLTAECTESINFRKSVLASIQPGIVVISAKYDFGENNRWSSLPLDEESSPVIKPALTSRQLGEAFQQTIDFIIAQGHTVYLVYPIPSHSEDPKRKILNSPESIPFGTTRSEYQKSYTAEIKVFNQLKAPAGKLVRISPESLFCDWIEPGKCVAHDHTSILYSTKSHLTYRGAGYLVNRILDTIKHASAEPGDHGLQR